MAVGDATGCAIPVVVSGTLGAGIDDIIPGSKFSKTLNNNTLDPLSQSADGHQIRQRK